MPRYRCRGGSGTITTG